MLTTAGAAAGLMLLSSMAVAVSASSAELRENLNTLQSASSMSLLS